MRPLRLEIKGFTAFREDTEIDFTSLDVFAISGPTGSGKSSLLDAMTYALYGRVERVGDRVSQLISQGRSRMAVTLEFEVGNERYRVTRSTPANRGTTRILVQRQHPGEDWEQAGDGSDRVRDADRMLERAIGLSYDGFTRSVLLPQGKFQEFLVGDAKKRREILIELLGLSLFRRMAERANVVGKEVGDRARWTNDLLTTEFADVTSDALKSARTAVKAAEQREAALDAAAQSVREFLARWQESERSAAELRGSAAEATAAAADATAAAAELGTLVSGFADSSTALDRCMAAAEAAHVAFAGAQASVEDADATLGPVEALADARVGAARLADATSARTNEDGALANVVAGANLLAVALGATERAVAEHRDALAAAELELRSAESALEEARHADRVAAVATGLAVGDPCPICGRPLEAIPQLQGAGALTKATDEAVGAKDRLERARHAFAEAERVAEDARRNVDANSREQDRLTSAVATLDVAMADARRALSSVLGDPLPDDPASEVERRLDERRALADAERGAADRLAEFRQAVLRAEKERDAIAAAIDRQRAGLAQDRRPLLGRATRALGSSEPPPELPSLPAEGGAVALHEHAEALVTAFTGLAERLSRELSERASTGRRLLEDALTRVAGLVEPATSLDALADAVDAACRSAAATVATSTKDAEDLAERLERKGRLSEEGKLLERRSTLFKTLALELRADRLIAYLQAEALQVLAAAGSDRLSNLSGGRYRLVFSDDEFLVVDTWNGDEERSVRTLSGGETFLASLSLALALADQVRSLSTTDRARIDSLFLDEGFGTLDAETLRVVVDAIELLAGDGRLVGVITHVRELAEQFPRIEVEKSPRGSRLKLVTS